MPDSDPSSTSLPDAKRDAPADDGGDHCRRRLHDGCGPFSTIDADDRFLRARSKAADQAARRLHPTFKQGSGRSAMTAAADAEL